MRFKSCLVALFLSVALTGGCSGEEKQTIDKKTSMKKEELNLSINSPAFQERTDEPLPQVQKKKPNPLDY